MACRSLIVVIVRARKAVHAPARMGDRQFVARGRVGCGRNVGVARCELARTAGDRHRIARAVSQQHPDAGRLKDGAAVAGAEGKVVATDLSPEMLAYGRERTAAAGLGNVEFVESQAASLNFPPESFDAALYRASGSSSSPRRKLRLPGCGAGPGTQSSGQSRRRPRTTARSRSRTWCCWRSGGHRSSWDVGRTRFLRLVTRLGHERLLRLERAAPEPAAARADRFRHRCLGGA